MSNQEEVEREVISLWEDLAEARGFGRVLGRVLYNLMIEGRPLSQREIAEKTGYSVPTVSRALNTLVSLGTVRKIAMPGSRLNLYRVEVRPQEVLSGGLMKWVSDAKTVYLRVSSILGELESVKVKDHEKAERLSEFLTKISLSIPRMIEIIEKAIEEMRDIS